MIEISMVILYLEAISLVVMIVLSIFAVINYGDIHQQASSAKLDQTKSRLDKKGKAK